MSDAMQQDALSVLGGLSASGRISGRNVFQTHAQDLPLPVPAYDGQSVEAFTLTHGQGVTQRQAYVTLHP